MEATLSDRPLGVGVTTRPLLPKLRSTDPLLLNLANPPKSNDPSAETAVRPTTSFPSGCRTTVEPAPPGKSALDATPPAPNVGSMWAALRSQRLSNRSTVADTMPLLGPSNC